HLLGLFSRPAQHLALGDGQVPQDRQVWEQVEVLEDHADPGPKQVDVGVWIGDVGSFDEDRAARGLLQTVHTAEQRRFPGPGRTDHAYHFARSDLEIDPLQHLEVTETLVEVADLDRRWLSGHGHLVSPGVSPGRSAATL